MGWDAVDGLLSLTNRLLPDPDTCVMASHSFKSRMSLRTRMVDTLDNPRLPMSIRVTCKEAIGKHSLEIRDLYAAHDVTLCRTGQGLQKAKD